MSSTVSDAPSSERKSVKYKEWRDKIFRRDLFKCRFCGKGGKLEAHHIYSYSDNVPLRYVLKNGITLCLKHHEAFHDEFGKGGNTPEQLEKFMKKKTVKPLMEPLF